MNREHARIETEAVKAAFAKTPPKEQESLKVAFEAFKQELFDDGKNVGFWSFLRLVMKLAKVGAFAVGGEQ